MEKTTVSLQPGQVDALDKLRREFGLSRSAMLRIALTKLLERPDMFLTLRTGKKQG